MAAFKMFHDTWNSTAWITNWDNVDIHTMIDSNDNGVTGNSAYGCISTGVNLVLDHPEYLPPMGVSRWRLASALARPGSTGHIISSSCKCCARCRKSCRMTKSS